MQDRPRARSWLIVATIAAALISADCESPPEPPTGGDALVVAVLPFEVLGQDEGAEYTGRSFAESLAIGLAQIDALELLDVPGGPVSDGETHRITGVLTRDGEAVDASLQLSDAASGELLWQTEMRSGIGDMARLATVLSKRTAEALGVSYPDLYDYIADVTGGPEMSASPLVERIADEWSLDVDGFLAASSELVEQHGDDPAAHALNAWALMQAWVAVPSSETLARLKERVVELDRIDPSSPYDDIVRAFVYRSSGEPDQARELYSRVLARTDLTNTLRAWALRQRSFAYLQIGDADAARRDAEQAIALDPSNARSLIALSKALEAMDRLDESIAASKQALTLEPLGWRHLQRLGIVASRAGKYDEAARSLERACQLGKSLEACANLAVTLQRSGHESEARAAIERTDSLVGTRWGFYNVACFWALAGDHEMALDGLRKALDLGFADALITTDSDLDALRGHPDFRALEAEVEHRLQSRRELSESLFPWQA